ncbi:PepSY domain-containing protein [Duganella sp. BJB476]|uniref:PepSY-associated TM helix domain-containing protein n=1 Tax=Duganella sp. BJB476 TaxID=1871176 RepID=UPI000E3525F6|nr:PepSY domain-containing protein [Duganella sp. BJB476]RFP35201.1 PepSY domain-containing protein [Duganella sp. BJB476]
MSSSYSATAAVPRAGLYRRIWRWHFFAGLVCVPFIFSLAVTGAMYLFHRQIDDLVYAGQMLRAQADSVAAVQPPSRLIAAALQSYPGRPKALNLPADDRHNAQVDVIRPDGSTLQVFINPATATVAGAIAEDQRIMTIVKRIHSLAIAGEGGKVVIEIVAGWIIVLISTGAYLWWPRGRRVGVVSIRPGAEGRTWWRDLHAVTGAFGGAVILFLALTGMPWSVFWGANVNAWLTAHDLGVPNGMWRGVPKSTLPAGALGALPWTQQQLAVPASDDPHAHHKATLHEANANGYALLSHPGTASPDAVVAQLASIGIDRGYRLALPRDPRGVYSAIRITGQTEDQRVIHIDQYSRKVLMDIGPDRIGAIGRITEWGVSVHQGGEYGTPNLLLMLAGCLALIALCVSGIVIWWKRRPTGRLAAPERRNGDQLARGVVLIAVVLGCCFQLLGASMLAVLLLDTLIAALRRPPTNHQ